MRFFIILFFSLLFGCDITNYNTAYEDYYKNQQAYIEALLENNKKAQIKILKELIKCGKYLHFNVNDYENKLKKLQTLYKKKQFPKTLNKPYKKIFSTNHIKSKYIIIYNYSPLKIKNVNNYTLFNIKTKNLYKKVIDLKYAITPKPYIKKTINNNLVLKIAQYKKNIVRIVYYSHKPIKLHIKKENNILIIKPITKYKNILAINNKKSQRQYHNLFQRKKIIVIDPGHGGKDSGGIGIGGRMEKIAVLEIAKYVKYYLQKEGYIVYMTRNKDIFRTLSWRTHFANEKHADLFISIHCNIAPHHIKYPHGIETYFLSPTRSQRAIRLARLENKSIKGLNYLDQNVILKFLNKNRIIASEKFAINVQSSMLKTLRKHYKNVVDGGVRPAPFYVLVGTQMPAILIETGFLTNPMEAKRLFNPTYQKLLAKGIAKGVKTYFMINH